MESHKLLRKVFLGGLFIAIGLALLGFNLNILPFEWKPYIFNWRALLVLLGVIMITKRNHEFLGFIFLVVATILYLPMLIGCVIDFHTIFWPVILIGAGLYIMVRKRKDRSCEDTEKSFRHCYEKKNIDSDNIIEDVSFFSGSEKVIVSENFEGGHIVTFFGGVNLNMQKANIAPGKCELEMIIGFGGCKIFVPSDWTVRIDAVSIFGGFVDKRIVVNKSPDPSKLLVIKGVAMFGGCEIRN